MAGRVQVCVSPTDHPQKNNTLILHFAVDVKRLVEEGKDFCWPRPEQCLRCKSRRLWGHGYVQRYFEGCFESVWIKRYRCPDCTTVYTLRPKGFYKRFHYSGLTILLSILNKILKGRWLKCLTRQVQQYWYKGFCFQACRYSNRKNPDIEVCRELFRTAFIPVTHSFQSEILHL